MVGRDFARADSNGAFGCRNSVPVGRLSCSALSPKRRRHRLLLVTGMVGLWVAAVVLRLADLQINDVGFWNSWGQRQHLTEIRLAPERGPLYDRNGRLLAVSVPAGSVYVRPRVVPDHALAAEKLSQVLGVKIGDVQAKLKKSEPFVWVKRQVPRALAIRAAELQIPGVGFLMESRRYYPYNFAASRLMGKVGIDGNGLSGLELLYDRHLSGQQLRSMALRDALGNRIETHPSADFVLPRGSALTLSVDAEIQSIVDQELEVGRKAAKARHALGVLVDADSGDVLALGQAPLLSFNQSRSVSRDDLKNLVAETVFEPGSIMKPLVAAAALDAGVVSADELLNCEHGSFPFGPHVIKDVHPYGVMSFFDVVVRSSNIGMSKVGARLGKEKLHDALVRFGLGQAPDFSLPGASPGILRGVEGWAKVDVATHSFGQGVAVTPIQMVRAVAAIANGGRLPTLRLLSDAEVAKPVRVISAATAGVVQEMMYGVVENEHGTGRKAAITGVRVGGKTGTAQKARSGARGYQPGAYVASFVGFVDAGSLGIDRRLALIVIIDEPHSGSIYGGTLAAPVFQRIMQRSLYVLSAEHELKRDNRSGESGEKAPELGWDPSRMA